MKHSKTKRIVSALLAAVVVLAALPAVGFAGGDASIEVYVTISVEGNIAKGKDDTPIALVPITLTGRESYTIDDALRKIHIAYHPSGVSGYGSSIGQYGLGVDKLWGDENGPYMYQTNNKSAFSLADPIVNKDHIYAYVLSDKNYWSDIYTKFNIRSASIGTDESIELTLFGAGFDSNFNTVWTTINGATIELLNEQNNSLGTTNEQGRISLSFSEEGEYYLTATKGGTNYVPPICKIFVSNTSTGPSLSDTTLSMLKLTFPKIPEATPCDGLPYINGNDFEVFNTVDKISVSASTESDIAEVTATYKSAGTISAIDYVLNSTVDLDVGQNTFIFTVTNDEDTQTHALHILRGEEESERNIDEEVGEVLAGINTLFATRSDADWILALNAANLDISESQKAAFLSKLLLDTVDLAHNNEGSPAAMAKAAIALTSLGIDATKVKDLYGGIDINLVQKIIDVYKDNGADPVYGAPYVLSLIDLPHYQESFMEDGTRETLINTIITAKDFWNEWDYDGTGIVLPALATYYDKEVAVNGISSDICDDVTTTVNAALDEISQVQQLNGSLGAPNSNTVATVIAGLNAIGINAHTNSQFKKAGSSLLMNLLSFRTGNDTLGFTSAFITDDYASLQGFQALATWLNLTNESGRSSNLYRFSKDLNEYKDWPDVKILTDFKIAAEPNTTVYNYDSGEIDFAPDTTGIELHAIINRNEDAPESVDIDDCTVSKIDRSEPGTQTVFVTYTKDGISITDSYFVTVLNKEGSTPRPTTVSVTVREGNRTIASNGSVSIEPNVSTALDVLKWTLDGAGVEYTIERSGYVKEIDGIGEFSTGANTGWMYSINGITPPTTAAADYRLKDGDVVRWYFTEDYTKDPSSKNWTSQEPDALDPKVEIVDGTATATLTEADLRAAVQNNTGTTLTIEPTGAKGANAVEVNIPAASAVSIASDTALDLSIVTPVGSVTMPNGTLASIASQAGTSITVRVEAVEAADLSEQQQQAIGQDPVYDISIFSGNTQISSFGGKSITISLLYELKKGEQAAGVAVWYLNDAGELERMRCTYNAATGMATFATTHLSKYIVGYTDTWYNPFDDVDAGDWFYDAVDFAVNHQLFDGISETAFAPDRSMTRAMLATVLHRLEGTPTPKNSAGFDDVELGRWYSEAIAWTTEQGITKGYDKLIFGTDDSVTREQVAEILYRYASYKNADTSARANLSAYSDNATISPWAEQGISWAVAAGLIQGVSASKLAPSALSTRAQVATVLMRWIGER